MKSRFHEKLEALRRGQSGQALVETALVIAIILLPLLAGTVELGRVVYAANEVSNAAKTAVQYGARSTGFASDTPGMLIAAQAETSDFVTASKVTFVSGTPSVSYICSDGSAATGLSTDCTTTTPPSHLEEILTVMTQATVDPVIHIPWLPHSYTLYGHATQKVLNQ
jgi:Flp pilus assembly protein TadG